jgi:P27 family predicted phage terminase small subunit
MPNPKGRPSRPTTLKRLDGVAKERINSDEAVTSGAGPVPPDDLPGAQRAIWDRLAEELGHMQLWHRADQDTLLAFCRWADRHEQAQRGIDRTGILVKNDKGQPMLNPLFRAAAEAAVRMQALSRELGLTPSARASLRTSLAQPAGEDLTDVRSLFG